MYRRFADLIINHPILVRAFLIAATVAAGLQCLQLRYDFTPQSIYHGADEIVAFSEEHRQRFCYEDAIILVVLEATGDDDVLAAPALSWTADVTRAVEQLPEFLTVESLATLKTARIRFRSGVTVSLMPFIRRAPVPEETAHFLRSRLADIPLIEGMLVSKDRSLSIIAAEVAPEDRDIRSLETIVEHLQEVLDEHALPSGYKLHLCGLPALRVDIVRSMQTDQFTIFPLSFVAFLVIAGLMFRSPGSVLAPTIAAFAGVLWTLGLMAAMGQTFSLLSNIMPTLVLVVGASNSVHIVSRYAEECAKHNGDRREAMRETLTAMTLTCALTFATTGIGFASLMAARSELLRELGFQAVMGMVCEYFSIVLTLGTILPLFRNPPRPPVRDHAASPLTRFVSSCAHVAVRHPATVFTGWLVAAALSLIAARNVEVNSRMLETYDEDHSMTQTVRMLEQRLAGLAVLEVGFSSGEENGLLDPEVFRRVRSFQQFAVSHDPVTIGQSWIDLFCAVSSDLAGALDEPASAAGDDYLMNRIISSHRRLERLAEASRYRQFLTADGRHGRMVLRLQDVGSAKVNRLLNQYEAKLEELFPQDFGVGARLTGDALLHARCMDEFVRDLFRSLLGASIVIFAIIAITFHSLRIGLLSSIPNLTPLMLTLGYIGLRDYEMTAGNVIVFAISLGIAVDNTIHFLTRFSEEYAAPRNQHSLVFDRAATTDAGGSDSAGQVAAALYHAYDGAGRAIILTSLLIICGLSVLLFSEFLPSRRFGELTSVTMIAALFGDLLLLPACIFLFWKRKPDNAV